MTEKLITIKEYALNNHCPECFSKTLHIVFKQKFKETKLYKSVTKETLAELHCSTCENIISPVQWTDDIERVFDYHQKAFKPKNSTLKLKRAAWLLIISGLIVVALSIIIPLVLLRQ